MASDLLIVYDNAIDRASIGATSTSGTSAVASNVANDIKGKAHRSGYKGSIGYSCSWGVNQTIGAVALPATNVSSAATLQVVVYSDSGYTNTLYATSATSAFQYTDISNWNGYSGSATANEFGSGRFSSGYVILNQNYTNVKSMKVTIAGDTSDTLIDNARIVAGRAWRPTRYASNGMQFAIDDSSTIVKTNSGNVVVDQGFQSYNMSFDIRYFDETDRAELLKILKLVGSSKKIFVSVFPSTATRLHSDYSVYGTVVKSPLTYEIWGFHTYSVSIEGW